jgi:hypothetical protein
MSDTCLIFPELNDTSLFLSYMQVGYCYSTQEMSKYVSPFCNLLSEMSRLEDASCAKSSCHVTSTSISRQLWTCGE